MPHMEGIFINGEKAKFHPEDILDTDASQYTEEIGESVTAYLTEHITNPSNPPIDTSLSIAGAAADAKETGDKISELKEDTTQLKSKLGDVSFKNGYIINNGGTIGDFTESDSYVTAKLAVYSGEKYILWGRGTTSARLWSTHDINGNTVRISDANAFIAQSNPFEITIAENEKYLVVNSVAATNHGIKGSVNSQSAYNTRVLSNEFLSNAIDEVKSKLDETVYTFKNNMQSDGTGNLPHCTITNGSYGESGSIYSFEMPVKKMHIYFEFMQTEAVTSENVSGHVQQKRLLSLFGNTYFMLNYSGSRFMRNELYQGTSLSLASASNGAGVALDAPVKYARMQGADAFSVQYTNELNQNAIGTIDFSDTGISVNVDGTITTISCTMNTPVADIVDSLNDINGIEAVGICVTEKTYGDLLPVVSKITATATQINLIYSGTLNNSTSYVDNCKVYIPLAVSEKWHSVEMLFNPSGAIGASFDGITANVMFSGNTNNNRVIINQSGSPYIIRNLEFDYDDSGSAELVDNFVNSTYTPVKQLISDHNPRVLIYEGHGIDVCEERDAPLTDNMACSTERLRILFATAVKNGYTPVTLRDIIEWKINRKPLPKRCFTIVFDDWRFENYVDYNKRKPFVDYNVKPALAVITGEHPLSDTYTINGISYTVNEIVKMTMTAGWYCVSHTNNHRILTNNTPSETDELLKTDVLAANRYGIYSNVLVYPQGEYGQQYKGSIKHSGFALGITIIADNYNCLGTDNCFLSRVELGTRATLETVLGPLT